jgi:hypothetical protein
LALHTQRIRLLSHLFLSQSAVTAYSSHHPVTIRGYIVTTCGYTFNYYLLIHLAFFFFSSVSVFCTLNLSFFYRFQLFGWIFVEPLKPLLGADGASFCVYTKRLFVVCLWHIVTYCATLKGLANTVGLCPTPHVRHVAGVQATPTA